MNLLIKAKHNGREIVHVAPESADWKYTCFSALRLMRGESTELSTNERKRRMSQ